LYSKDGKTMPKPPLLNMFGRSPIRPLEEHMDKVYLCVQELKPFFTCVLAQQWPEVEVLQRELVRLENEADNMKRDLRLQMPKGLFMPVSRSDLLELLNVQDRLANKAKDIAGLVLGRKMIFPAEITEPFLEFLLRCIEAAKKANVAIHELDELFETGFSGNEIKLVESMIVKLSRVERDTDEKQIRLRQILFNIEHAMPPIEVMFLYKIIEWTGELADRAREIGDKLQILLAR
jgi:predicted phosphate transport protein (TIGR00153 family)